MGQLFVLETQFSGMMVRVQVNGVVRVSDDSLDPKTIATTLNPYVVEGANQVAVALRRPSDATLEGLKRERRAQSFAIRVMAGVRGREPGPEGRLFADEWPSAQHPSMPDDTWQVVVDRPFTAQVAFGRWAWQDAPAVAPGDPALSALAGAVLSLHAAAASADTASLLDAHRLKFSELSRALGMAEDRLSMEMGTRINSMSSAPDFRVETLDPSDLRIEPLAGGRLMRVRRAAGEAPVTMSGGGQSLELNPIYVLSGGRWQIAR